MVIPKNSNSESNVKNDDNLLFKDPILCKSHFPMFSMAVEHFLPETFFRKWLLKHSAGNQPFMMSQKAPIPH